MLDRETVLQLARLLNEVVVSGDRIGTTFHDEPAEGDRRFGQYCRDIDLGPRAARLRRELFDVLWPDAPPEDDDRIEVELAAHYWKP